jgi:hypothetical protein
LHLGKRWGARLFLLLWPWLRLLLRPVLLRIVAWALFVFVRLPVSRQRLNAGQ